MLYKNDRDFYKNYVYKRYLRILSKPAPYTFWNPKQQLFSLPLDVILRILHQKRSPSILFKLYQSCKYFFKKLSVLPIHHCECWDASVYSNSNYGGYHGSKKVLFWFYNELNLCKNCNSTFRRIHSCTVQNLNLYSCILTFDEFNLVVSESTIEYFFLQNSNIIDSNGSTIPINLILQSLPHCTNFSYQNENELFSRETLLAMNDLKINEKFSKFELRLSFVSTDFDPILLWNFIKNNCAFDSKVSISLFLMKHNENREDIHRNLVAAFKISFDGWKGKLPIIHNNY